MKRNELDERINKITNMASDLIDSIDEVLSQAKKLNREIEYLPLDEDEITTDEVGEE